MAINKQADTHSQKQTTQVPIYAARPITAMKCSYILLLLSYMCLSVC